MQIIPILIPCTHLRTANRNILPQSASENAICSVFLWTKFSLRRRTCCLFDNPSRTVAKFYKLQPKHGMGCDFLVKPTHARLFCIYLYYQKHHYLSCRAVLAKLRRAKVVCANDLQCKTTLVKFCQSAKARGFT